MTETTQDIKQRLIQESRAMLLYISGRGLGLDPPKDGSMDFLDLSPAEQRDISIDKILNLHQMLARVVAPAMPETIEQLHYHQTRANEGGWQFWRRFAPLTSVLWLLMITIGIAASLAYLIGSSEPLGIKRMSMEPAVKYLQGSCRQAVLFDDEVSEMLSEAVKKADDQELQTQEILLRRQEQQLRKKCLTERATVLFHLYLLFGMIGALGAAYSSIYDSFAYIREGRYDLRLASTYYVRIFLGAFSGILLAEPLAEYLQRGAFSSTLLAFMGGFAAQLVYDLLTKIVDSIANMFRPDRRREQYAIHEQAELNARQTIIDDETARRRQLAKIVEAAQGISDPAARAQTLQKAVLHMMSGDDGDVSDVLEPGAEMSDRGRKLADLSGLLELAGHVMPLLPDAPDADGLAELDAARARLGAAGAGLTAPGGAAEQQAADEAAAAARALELISPMIASAMDGLAAVFEPEMARAIGTAGILVSDRFDAVQRLRWHAVAYDAEPDSRLRLVADAGDGALLDDSVGDPLATSLRKYATTHGAGALRAALSTGDNDSLFKLLQPDFADRAAFDAGLAGWADQLAARLLLSDLDREVLPHLTGVSDAAALVAALGRVAASDAATAGLQKLELIGDGISACARPEPVLATVLARIGAATSKGASG